MFGNKKNLEKREPRGQRISNRKLVNGKTNSGGTSNHGGSSGNYSGSGNTSSGSSLNILGLLFSLFSIFSSGRREKKGGSGGILGCLGCLGTIVIGVLVLGFVLLLLAPDTSHSFVVEEISNVKTNLHNESGYNWLRKNNAPADKRPYTLMIYLNGSDLESKYGLASTDISEMMSSRFDSKNLNVIVLTGGTKDWKSDSMSESLTIYQVFPDKLLKLCDLGNGTIADKELLSSFIDYSKQTFPADKYGFIFWNHGGGTLHGYGSDENFKNAGLSIAQIKNAFGDTNNNSYGFEFIGFDCCLMATVETAELLSPYGRYFIASAETEPGTGWDYSFLDNLSQNPNMSGLQIGKVIVDKFIASNQTDSREATLSVVDLTNIYDVVNTFDEFAGVSRDAIARGNFNTISRARSVTKTFGNISETASYDLIDIKHLAENLSSNFPNEANAVIAALDNCVVYNKTTSVVRNSNGLTTYIPYVGKNMAKESVEKYSTLGMFPKFTGFLADFSSKLTGERINRGYIENLVPERVNGDLSIKISPDKINEINKIQLVVWKQLEEGSDYFIRLYLDTDVDIQPDGTITTEFAGYWGTINGQVACFYEVERDNDNYTKYIVPAKLNDQDVNLTVIFDDDNPDGKILGAVPETSAESVAPGYVLSINSGDTISLKYFAQLFLENEDDISKYTDYEKWILGDEFTVGNELKVEISPVDDSLYMYGFWVEDTLKNTYYTDFIEIWY